MKSSEKSHKASMNNFDKEYNRTEKEVYKKTQKREKIACKIKFRMVISNSVIYFYIPCFRPVRRPIDHKEVQ